MAMGFRPFSWGKFGVVPDPPEYPEYDGCPYDYAEFEQGDECIGCIWRETCEEVMRE